MAVLIRKVFLSVYPFLITLLLSCSSAGDLTSVANTLVDTQRQLNLTRDTLSGVWNGTLYATDGVGSQTFLLVFHQDIGFSLDGSLLVGEDIRLGGTVSQDTFALINGVFTDNEIRFNIAPSAGGGIVVSEGDPVLFTGQLTENTFMSGQLKASDRLIGLWELVFGSENPETGGE